MQYQRVIIETPYHAPTPTKVEENIAFAKQCILDSLSGKEYPFASHLFYTQPGLLADHVPTERICGINCGYAWMAVAELVAFYIDRGFSKGMLDAMKQALVLNIPIEIRILKTGASYAATKEVSD